MPNNYEDPYNLRDLEDNIGNIEAPPNPEADPGGSLDILSLACSPDAADYGFMAKTRTHDVIRFAYASCTPAGRVTLYDGDVKGVDGDTRAPFDTLDLLDVDNNLVWLSARRK
jgi:hypothetical protein